MDMSASLAESACAPHATRVRGFAWPVRVYYEDTDAGGIVFYANYLKFFERARTEWLRACGVEQQWLASERDAVFVVRSTNLDYRLPARLDDVLSIASRIERLGRASVDFAQEAWRGDALLVAGEIRVGCVSRATLRPMPIPPGVLDALRRGPHGSCEPGRSCEPHAHAVAPRAFAANAVPGAPPCAPAVAASAVASASPPVSPLASTPAP